ncbi:MAG: hypothetical protein JWN06_2193 [Propionibacteriaceae bacterium]|nr:hypothetical protein [Propionibacteriaceae bacterium]
MSSPSTSTLPRRLSLLVALCLGVLALLAGPLTLTARAEGTASSFVVNANLTPDGTLRVQQTITFAGPVPATVTQKIETRQNLIGDRQYVYTVSGISANAKGTDLKPAVSDDDSFTTVSINTNGSTEITMAYTVVGAVVRIDSGTALRWQLLQGLSAQVTEFTGTVAIPGTFSYVKCTAGPPNATTPCAYAAAGVEDAQIPTFRDGPRGEGEVVAVDIGFPPGMVAANEQIVERWTVRRAFSAGPVQLGTALGLLLLGGLGLFLMHRRAGADVKRDGELSRVGGFVPVAEGQSVFRVVDDIRPGHVGTLVDERVDPIDITATLLDLAVRGHLVITELPKEERFGRTDWTLERTDTAAEALLPFEQALLEGIIPDRRPVRVSELSERVQGAIGGVQDRLYDEVVRRGWYERRPDATRNKWTQLGIGALIVAVVVTGLLAAFTTFGLVGLVLIVLALGLIFVGQEMPARTAHGSAVLAGLAALRSDLLSHPTDQVPPGHELQEYSKVLPYAVVLGGAERWLEAMVAADTDDLPDPTDLSWYHGPDHWHLADLPYSLRNFITILSGCLSAR